MTIFLALLVLMVTALVIRQLQRLTRMWRHGFVGIEGAPVRRADDPRRFWRGILMLAIPTAIQAAAIAYVTGWVLLPRLLDQG